MVFNECAFRFSLEIETYYTPDGGHQENVFNLSDSELRNRVVDLIDVVRDQVRISSQYSQGPLQIWTEHFIQSHLKDDSD